MTIADILCLPGWKAGEVVETIERTIISASVREAPLACPLCGSVRSPYHFGYRPYCIADLPIRMRPVTIAAHRHRYRCRDCSGTFLDQLPSIHAQHDATERLVNYIESQSLQLTATFTSLAASLGISEKLVRNVFLTHIERLEREYVIETPRYLGIDEIYVGDAVYCVLTDLERHAVVDLLPKRDMETVKKWLKQLPAPSQVEAVAMDLWNPYRLSVREVLPHACIVADKYHVLRLANEVGETVRKSLRSELTPAAQRQLKQDRKILLKRAHDLTDQQRLILESWTGLVPVLHELYRVKEQFFEVYEVISEQEAYARYLAWQQQIPPSLHEAFLPLQLTVETWGDEIFAFFKHSLTNAFTERTNLSLRETTRIAFGLSYRTLRAKLLFCPSNVAARCSSPRRFQPQGVSAQL